MQGRVRELQPVRLFRGESPQRSHTYAHTGATMEQNPLWQHCNSPSNGTLTTPECKSLIADIRRTRRVDADMKRSCARGKGRQGRENGRENGLEISSVLAESALVPMTSAELERGCRGLCSSEHLSLKFASHRKM